MAAVKQECTVVQC